MLVPERCLCRSVDALITMRGSSQPSARLPGGFGDESAWHRLHRSSLHLPPLDDSIFALIYTCSDLIIDITINMLILFSLTSSVVYASLVNTKPLCDSADTETGPEASWGVSC